MKKCPFCAEEIQDESVKCRFCGEWLGGNAKDLTSTNKEALSPWSSRDTNKSKKHMKFSWKVLLPIGLAVWLLGKSINHEDLLGEAMGATFQTMGTIIFFVGVYRFVYRKKDSKQTPQV